MSNNAVSEAVFLFRSKIPNRRLQAGIQINGINSAKPPPTLRCSC